MNSNFNWQTENRGKSTVSLAVAVPSTIKTIITLKIYYFDSVFSFFFISENQHCLISSIECVRSFIYQMPQRYLTSILISMYNSLSLLLSISFSFSQLFVSIDDKLVSNEFAYMQNVLFQFRKQIY